jgi:SAM-dependent methyltransferase
MNFAAEKAPKTLSPRQAAIRDFFDRAAVKRTYWVARNRAFYAADAAYMRFLVPPGAVVLEIGCGDGQLLAALAPAKGCGVDLSPAMIELAETRYPQFSFHRGNGEDPAFLETIEGPFDVIILSDTIGYLEDCEAAFTALRRLATPRTRLIVAYYSRLWKPALTIAERFGFKMRQPPETWLSTHDTMNLLSLAGFETVWRDWRQLLPRRLLGLGPVVNRYVAPLPLVRRLCLRNYVVARPIMRHSGGPPPSVSIVIPCRNEQGNIATAIERLPRFAPEMEILFVEGHSKDGTYDECLRVRDAWPELDIKVMRQDGKGKGDAVRKGFAAARGDILMILDADLTVPPESLGKFYEVLVDGKGEFVNGTRLVYPMERGAMRFLNRIANGLFARTFSYLLNQRFTDTLCGTKALWRIDYERLAAGRSYFGDFDPFGDFDLIFGATKLNLKVVEVPIRYADRTYGETQISRFRHGLLLARMVLFSWRKLKAL